ncbi:hypothetical protein Hypma_003618 [Hypsizygus marmoreus]|uniref:MYND-type domain-containing protein n=1 Tax=Hypsizygus marmoreus TaxID=39966 RepID=A0A369J417_HYPMA|nr:hypothetical protein Hypma_003618 [Hypsizygus marmoreus]
MRGRQSLQITDYDNAIAWNSACEREAVWDSALVIGPRADLRRLGEVTEFILSAYQMNYAYLCNLQYDLTRQFTYNMAAGFEGQWLAATASVRRDHALEGHIRAAIAGLDCFRGFCGDLTLASLEKNGGKGFLNLLRIYLHDDLSSVPKIPISLPYNGTSGIPTPSNTDGWRAYFALSRDLYICSFLHFTLDSWEGSPRPVDKRTGGKTLSLKGELGDEFMKRAQKFYSAPELKKMKQNLRSRHAAAIRRCESCGKPESITKPMHCKNCLEALNRKTSYCSKQCQKDDWPRHKQICGKKMTLATAQSTALPRQKVAAKTIDISQLQIGPTIGGYKRSPALIAQVHRLNLEPSVDYFLTHSSGETTSVSLGFDPSLQRGFRTIRDRAVTTGDRSAVAALGEFLMAAQIQSLTESDAVEWSPEPVKNQLVLEYGEGTQDDIDTLMLISSNNQTLGVTQVQRHLDGQEIYDVSDPEGAWENCQLLEHESSSDMDADET